MTSKQESLYWHEWAAVRAENPRSDRHDLHVQALGKDKSHKDFSNKDFDAVLAVFRSISQPDDVNAQLRQIDGERRRCIYAIAQTGFSDSYIRSLAIGKFATSAWRDLPEDQLRQLKITLQNRARTRDKRTPIATTASENPNEPF
jgi:hypothetical protein